MLQDYTGPARVNDDPFLKGADIVKHQMARGYMNGVKDASEGTQWCNNGRVSHEVNEDIATELRKLTPAQRKGPAAPLVIQALQKRFPCTSVRSSK
ncbi:hypothetical protein INH39_15965 [Massilia violaceinigra]|uniref:Rap1a immunity protein domain-containing protein n=1 Tax=Massilia violaceinigra TaxID=2045208 RepID=A0ABY4AK47_9BURK|nr:Rap1a/Tai family immunity protein [Massilia violaceinigra]UOD32993.1 hypothetical protein INH39_15965 [Massilia violaceinigra]